MQRSIHRGWIVLVVVLLLLPHAPSLFATFTYDDRPYVLKNTGIQSWGAAVQSFGQSWPPNDDRSRRLYRPMTQLSYALDYSIAGGSRPFVFHAMNLFLYAITLLLLLGVARFYLGDGWWAIAAVALFASHPLHCEVVDSVTGRSEMLALLFGLLCWFQFLRWQQTRQAWRVGLSLLAYAAAAFSKETGLMFGAVVFAHVWFHPLSSSTGDSSEPPQKSRWVPAFLLLSFAPVYLVLRHLALDGNLSILNTTLGHLPWHQRLYNIGVVFVEYFKLFVAPFVLQVDPYYHATVGVTTKLTPSAFLGMIFLASLVGFALWKTWQYRPIAPSANHAETTGTAPFLVASLLILYFPVSQVIPFGTLMAERLVYSASVPAVLLVVYGAQRLFERRQSPRLGWTLASLCLLVVLLFSLRSYMRAQDWKTPLALWTSAAQYASHPSIHKNLGLTYLERKEYGKAQQELFRVLSTLPNDQSALFNLAVLADMQHRVKDALQLYKQLLRFHPHHRVAQQRVKERQATFKQAQTFLKTWLPKLKTTRDLKLLNRIGAACVQTGQIACANDAVRRMKTLQRR